jgi:hypothetical protein
MSSYGDEIAATLSNKLGWPLITREEILADYFNEVANPYEIHMLSESAKYFLKESRAQMTYLEHAREAIYDRTRNQSAIILGFGSQMSFAF